MSDAFQLDHLKRIVNVHWLTFRDMVIAYGVKGDPQFFIRFTTPKASYPAGTTTLPAPVFGAAKNDVPTDTREVELNAAMPVNNTVVATAAHISIDCKAYLSAALLEWVGVAATLTGEVDYYNPSGEAISDDEVPEVPPGHKGKVIFTNPIDRSVVYAQYSGPGGDGRIYMLDEYGEEVWTIEGTPETVNYDEETERIISPGQRASDEINFYDPEDGTLLSAVTLAENIHEVSREGKVYVFTALTGSTFPGIKGYTREGAELFSIAGESSSTGTQFDSIVAYGEDYIVVTGTFPQTNTFSFITINEPESHFLTTVTSTIKKWVMVYNANTGTQISKTLWGNDVNTVNTDSVPPPHFGTQSHSSTDRESYASVVCIRSVYLPERPEEAEEA